MPDEHPIAVFGSSEPLPGEPLYQQAYELGRRLAATGFTVVTGGYGGVMEGASRGATEHGGRALGVTCETFHDRRPNRYLSHSFPTPDLFRRQQELIERSRGFVVLEGRAGTLSELGLLWALHRAGCLGRAPVVLLGVYWSDFLQLLQSKGTLERAQLDVTRLVTTPVEAVEALQAMLGGTGGA